MAPGWSRFFLKGVLSSLNLFLEENSSTFEGGAKIVPQMELSYAP